jgi:predicted alpha/beta hydrolase family esterase
MNCIIIHGCPSDNSEESTKEYAKHWMPWVKNQLELNGIKTDIPLMPFPWSPVYKDYRKVFEKYKVSEGTILIGHSCGCAFLVRWLGDTKKKIKKLILVAPWKIPPKGDIFREKFYNFLIDETIKSRVQNIIMFTADNERQEGKQALSGPQFLGQRFDLLLSCF